jgi:hypothetical protein
MGNYILQPRRCLPTFERNVLPPFYSYALKTEAAYFSETAVNFYQIARYHIQEDYLLRFQHFPPLSLQVNFRIDGKYEHKKWNCTN